MNIECPGCRRITTVDDKEILKQLNPDYPAQRVVINCACGETQHIIERKRPRSGDIKATTTDRISS